MAQKKYYVVWRGVQPGIYTQWEACKVQIEGFSGARYKSFKTKEEAEKAFREGASAYIEQGKTTGTKVSKRKSAQSFPDNPPDYRHDTVLPLPIGVEADAIAVDAACSGNPGKMEYRGIDLTTGAVVFHYGPIWGTNNIGEFLAIVHALAYMEQKGIVKTIYSDSRNALLWIKAKKCKTTLKKTAKSQAVFDLIERAEQWLSTHKLTVPLKKWATSKWGEIPADFGRK